MWSEYEMTLSQAKELKKDDFSSLPEIRRQIEELKGKIKALGNINVNAIEDYKEVSERYEFMRTQHEDLVMAQAELEKIIEELDTGMRRQFDEKFREIRAEFDKVFTAEDCGSAIKGNRIDIFMESEAKCNEWGVKNITIYMLK
mgnify:FL=1